MVHNCHSLCAVIISREACLKRGRENERYRRAMGLKTHRKVWRGWRINVQHTFLILTALTVTKKGYSKSHSPNDRTFTAFLHHTNGMLRYSIFDLQHSGIEYSTQVIFNISESFVPSWDKCIYMKHKYFRKLFLYRSDSFFSSNVLSHHQLTLSGVWPQIFD